MTSYPPAEVSEPPTVRVLLFVICAPEAMVRLAMVLGAAITGAFGVPDGTVIGSPAAGTPAGGQFDAVAQSVLVAPFHVRAVPLEVVAVPVTTSGFGNRPVAVTFRTLGPATPIGVQDVCARPVLAALVALGGEAVPVPEAGVKVTVTPPTPLPNTSLTFTTIGFGNGTPPATDCPPPLTSDSVLAGPAEIVNAGPSADAIVPDVAVSV